MTKKRKGAKARKLSARENLARALKLADKLHGKLHAIDERLAMDLIAVVAAFGHALQARTDWAIRSLEREQRALDKEW